MSLAFIEQYVEILTRYFRDRRSLGSTPTPSGVLIGHTEGITYVSAKGDGRYVISNGKDQVLRLWDLRMMRSNADYQQVRGKHYGIPGYDYRWVVCTSSRRRGLKLTFSAAVHHIPSRDTKRIPMIAVLCNILATRS